MYIARIAVATATYSIDLPYSYKVPDELKEHLQPGMRVLVPFGTGNRTSEGLVLSLEDSEAVNTDAFRLFVNAILIARFGLEVTKIKGTLEIMK